MIELHHLSLDESLDSTTLNTDRSFSIISSSLGQYSSKKYVLVDNHKVNHAKPSPCWNRFALPVVKDENNRNIVIKNFATCRSCYATYVFTYGSTKSLNSHKCVKELSSISTSPSTKSPSLNSKINRFSSEKKKTLTSLIALWICQSIRPISIVEDEGFLNIIQQYLSWDGGLFNNIYGNDILPSRSTITREIKRQANDIREHQGSITGALSRFGLDQLMDKITFVCDRGSNLIKALEDYQVVHCFPYRLNNVLKRTFYSAGTKEKKQRKQRKESLKKNQNNDQFNWNNSNDDDNVCLTYYDDRDSSESETDDNIVLDEKSVELALRSLSSSLNVNWHPKLETLSKSTIKQAIIVRWLTMSQLLESILSSYSALTSIASEEGALHTLPTIDVSTVATINGLFLPWKEVIERLQATNTSSLHLVVTSYWYLLESLVVTKDEVADKAAQDVVLFKRHARQLLKAMFSLHDLYWIAAILNPHRRMLKHATDVERAHAYCLVRARVAKLMKMAQIDNNEEVLSSATISSTPPPRKKLKSYTTQFHDDTDLGETSSNMTIAKRARRELEIYLQLNLTNC
ncbi:unnamed protein product [Rotaria sp. Silwood1]|nr:unnamed protein product [Rotaria sp. Silwood1]CAF1607807.1 unnamed protein product [Rotaria sp. Silwood1]